MHHQTRIVISVDEEEGEDPKVAVIAAGDAEGNLIGLVTVDLCIVHPGHGEALGSLPVARDKGEGTTEAVPLPVTLLLGVMVTGAVG
ncbi:MAG: hypothetical protein TE42_06995 [Candidatus Synechococcus spongiarum SP3]|uniref:Uncharacterized protein n=1 Tax=Candidatus Synechococcus spongiarum SP3 TaxID=1604020 RepID=A0A0G2IW18_9SYNE|nr:MAG: hypothetical protein TE42_06995 [Candidatus Synechococcus spongiarum SP3]